MMKKWITSAVQALERIALVEHSHARKGLFDAITEI